MKDAFSNGALAVLLALSAATIPDLALAASDQAAGVLEGAPKPSRADYPVIAGISARTLAWGLSVWSRDEMVRMKSEPLGFGCPLT